MLEEGCDVPSENNYGGMCKNFEYLDISNKLNET